jgi:mRNA-degrading endonuclease YafQ of YafQ-DinJ toxin-antitoxin module
MLWKALLFSVIIVFQGWAQTSPHGKLALACQTCHETSSWKFSPTAVFNHAKVGFALAGRHGTIECASCHRDLKFTGLKPNCLSCHTDVHRSEMGTDCARCHSATTWKIADMRQRHELTRFPLVGIHATLDCASCHTNAASHQYTGMPTTCIGCHRTEYEATRNPNHATAGFSTECTQCHQATAAAWGGSFDHSMTAFPLTGAHTAAACLSCHANKVFQSAPTECYACHQSDFVSTRNPNHSAAGFPTTCQTCHTTSAWAGGSYDHNTTHFPLTGAHRSVNCSKCHQNNQYAGLPSACYDCHAQDFNRTRNPNHVAGNFSHDCTQCHTTNDWEGGQFNHAQSGFPLTGAHVAAACRACHTNGDYQLIYTDCYQCHATQFAQPTDPNHVGGNFHHDCTECHTTASWQPSTFTHNSTAFPLTGAHQSATCNSCHVNDDYQNRPTDCYGCHISNYIGSTNPNHVAGNFSHVCQTCHTTAAWSGATFDHTITTFTLTGAHVTTPCTNCHVNGNYQLVYSECFQCHAIQFQQATNPNHVTGGFSHDCLQCHSTNDWSGATFNHALTNFSLTGAHATAACQSCHVNGNYQLVYVDCYQCHQAQFATPTNPNHVAGNFSHDCTTCHTTTAWTPSTFSHNTTPFPLTGAHQSVSCNGCHINNQYANLPADCYDCHAGNFNSTTNPNHVAGQFSHDCTQCHSTNNWSSTTFNHALTNFPLTGAHTSSPCQSCHVNGNYQLVYVDCYQCHQSQFSLPTNPNHVAGNFDHNCTPCHTTTSWSPSTFNHSNTVFPLTGAHVSVACNSCHVNDDYQNRPTDCFGCHATDFNGTTNPNHPARNFSHQCTDCHTTASWQGATFNHSLSNFPLTGSHVATPCLSCHVGGNYNLTYNDCYQCHQAQYQQATNPNHVTLLFNHNCTPCHTTTSWLPSTFNHDTQYFRIYSGHHNGRWSSCSQCHPSIGNYEVFTCISCHDHNQSEMDNEHRNVPGYIYSSPACYTCHRNT